ncbi:MAG: DUF2029 domain-containing protein [Proteobacteria bacterium]|nr:DUF2029 domain-containing protein [Pseudomonadota bacterium]
MATIGLLIGWVVSQLLGPGLTDSQGNVIGNDFIAFFAGAKLVADGLNPYDLAVMGREQHTLVPEYVEGAVTPYLNPPVALLWYRPLVPLGLPMALVVWWLSSAGAWVLGHAVLRDALDLEGRWSLRQMLVVALLFPPTLFWFMYGQATAFAFALLAGSLALLLREKDFAAGFVLGLLAFKPNLALGLALPLMVRMRLRALAGGVTSVALQVAAAHTLWPEQFPLFWAARDQIVGTVVDPNYLVWGVQSVYGFWHLLLGPFPNVANALTTLTGVSVLGVLVLGWVRVPWQPSSQRWQLAVAATLLACLPLGLQLYSYDVALFLLPFWLVASQLDTRSGVHPALDGGPVLVLAAMTWVLALCGHYLSMVQLTALGFAVQIMVPFALFLAWWLWGRSMGTGSGNSG